jgi:hypothetical protein
MLTLSKGTEGECNTSVWLSGTRLHSVVPFSQAHQAVKSQESTLGYSSKSFLPGLGLPPQQLGLGV